MSDFVKLILIAVILISGELGELAWDVLMQSNGIVSEYMTGKVRPKLLQMLKPSE